MSVILRTVALEPKPEVKEYFLGYVEVFETTGLNLSNVILDKLQELQIPFENCRGQAYDNGANMKVVTIYLELVCFQQRHPQT
ncbi:zinc finger MYM-type 1-like protein [Labeo rohita]|uniref:Zinc finger MYM-type 1-like protein n=1 Tax=Labeo rohita TaxID=84645 RepID=A0A498M1X0_LABRO|nr:zinc finger MYM-type 1-like protein [Labeo rohita]